MHSRQARRYTYDDNGMILIPVSDVEVAAVKLYGPEVKLTHTSLDEDGISYTYDAENNVYRVPMEWPRAVTIRRWLWICRRTAMSMR